MEDISVSHNGHKILYDFKNVLEGRHKVKILMPDIQNPELCVSGETIFVKIVGNVKNIRAVQRFLDRKLAAQKKAQDVQVADQSVILLDSDSDDNCSQETETNLRKIKKPPSKKRRTDKLDLVLPAVNLGNQSPPCEVTSTTKAVDESVIILDESVTEEFIPISTNGPYFNKVTPSTKISPETSNDIIVISSDEEDTVNQVEQIPQVPKAIFTAPRQLRPIVIDGSNVARAHGKPQNTYSCKGIEICINYFLQRGHPQVTAFVPLFRRHCKYGPVITTDQEILERFEKTQNVVFTPSRRLENGKSYSCYDDRFIVELAVSNGGVILSNDNYKDLLDESEAFSETIKNRLLMYCFVGDMLMIPADPLGTKGPKLDEFLSFPPAVLGSGS